MTKNQYDVVRKHISLAIKGEPMPSASDKSSVELAEALDAFCSADADKFQNSRIAIGHLAGVTLRMQLRMSVKAESEYQKILALGGKAC